MWIVWFPFDIVNCVINIFKKDLKTYCISNGNGTEQNNNSNGFYFKCHCSKSHTIRIYIHQQSTSSQFHLMKSVWLHAEKGKRKFTQNQSKRESKSKSGIQSNMVEEKKSYKIQVMKSRIKFDFSRNFLHYGFITDRGRFLLLSCYGYYCSLALSLSHSLLLFMCVCVYFIHHHLHISVLNHEMWFIKIKVEKRERKNINRDRMYIPNVEKLILFHWRGKETQQYS